MLAVSIIGIYLISLLVIFFYAIIQFRLAIAYIRAKKKIKRAENIACDYFPSVTIQLPVYNEKYVVEKLLEATVNINWPADKLEIQVLDDSTDETRELLKNLVPKYQQKGVSISLVTRDGREGFKAGALKHGLSFAEGEFIAIFDADFLPDPNFLLKTIPHFKDPEVGVVQTRWDHINRNYSVLTQLQAFALDAHFTSEQVGRNVNDFFINFNGTAGVWRVQTISDAGGWEADTLTEDLDLSYRAQLKGWKFVYRGDVLSPAELPVTMAALKSQQFRWTKGGAETFKKMALRILKTPGIRFSERVNGLAHLFNSSVFIFVLLLSISSVGLLYLASDSYIFSVWLDWVAVFFVSTVFLFFYFAVSFREKARFPWLLPVLFLMRFIQFLTVSLGLSIHNTRAVLGGYFGKKSEFVRTPKFNVASNGQQLVQNSYLSVSIHWSTWLELALFFLFAFAVIFGYKHQIYGLIPFHLMAAIGFISVFLYTVFDPRKR